MVKLKGVQGENTEKPNKEDRKKDRKVERKRERKTKERRRGGGLKSSRYFYFFFFAVALSDETRIRRGFLNGPYGAFCWSMRSSTVSISWFFCCLEKLKST